MCTWLIDSLTKQIWILPLKFSLDFAHYLAYIPTGLHVPIKLALQNAMSHNFPDFLISPITEFPAATTTLNFVDRWLALESVSAILTPFTSEL